MKIGCVFRKSLKENLRDWKILIMTLAFAPFFVLIMYLFYGESTQYVRIIVCNQDERAVLRDGNVLNAGSDLVDKINEFKAAEEGKLLQLIACSEVEEAKNQLKNGQADLLMVIPMDFSAVIKQQRELQAKESISLTFYGSAANPKYIMAAALTYSLVNDYVMSAARIAPYLVFHEEFLEKSKPRSEFDYYVPGLLILSVIMVLFTAAASIIKENDKRTMQRLRISQLNAFDFLTGISLVQVIITLAAIMLTYLTVLGLGYQPAGSMTGVLVIGFVSSLALIAISLIVASFLNTIFDLMTIGCFPFFILMFFSGGMFPLPRIPLFNLGERVFNLTDVLPTTHAITALNKILNFGFGLRDVWFETAVILALTVLYFIPGVWLFKKRHMSSN